MNDKNVHHWSYRRISQFLVFLQFVIKKNNELYVEWLQLMSEYYMVKGEKEKF